MVRSWLNFEAGKVFKRILRISGSWVEMRAVSILYLNRAFGVTGLDRLLCIIRDKGRVFFSYKRFDGPYPYFIIILVKISKMPHIKSLGNSTQMSKNLIYIYI